MGGGSGNLYAYVLSDPVNILDVVGLQVGDVYPGAIGSYPSTLAAAEALRMRVEALEAAEDIGPSPEYGAYIYPNYEKGGFSTSDIVEGDNQYLYKDDLDKLYDSCPELPVADFHSHPDPSPGLMDRPSSYDYSAKHGYYAEKGILESYLRNRGGVIIKY